MIPVERLVEHEEQMEAGLLKIRGCSVMAMTNGNLSRRNALEEIRCYAILALTPKDQPREVATVPEYVTSNAVRKSRDMVLKRAMDSKQAIIDFLQSGDRRYGTLRELVEEHADAQNASDVLSGQTHVTR